MRSHTPQEGERSGPGGRRGSLTSRLRASTSALPRPQTNLRETRISSFRATQPTYNLITGAEPNSRPSSRQSYAAESVRPGSRESSKENMAPPDADEYEKYRKEIESLKAEIGTLQYRMQTAEQEKEIALSQQNNKLEQARRSQQDEAQQRQLAETDRAKATEQAESVRRELDELREKAEAEQKSWERKTREAQDEARLLQEQLDDLSSAREEAARIAEKKMADLQMQITACQNSIQVLEQEGQTKDDALQHSQTQLADRDGRIAELEADVLRLKAQSGDAETMEIIKRELSEQVQHIRALEATNRDQLSELKHLRSVNKAVEIVEEEKRTLQRRLESAETLEAELTEARLQRQRLEDERRAWTSYLQNASETDDDVFDSPEAMARALVQERLTTASYVEQLGALRAEMAAQENTTQSLKEERTQLKEQLETAKDTASTSATDKARLRLDRQRALALKEVEYLRAQLKAIDEEDHTMQPGQYDEARVARVQALESIVDDYKAEVQTLHAELSSREPQVGTPQPAAAGTKRSRLDDDETQEQLGQLSRKNRKLQDELTSLQTKASLLEKDLAASREQLLAAKERGQTRVLSLRSNPTSDHEAIKRSTLEALQNENRDLLANLRARHPDPSVPVIPTSVLGAMEREIAAAKAETASAKKSAQRLKEVWGSKSHEFKEAIFSTLGWTVTFIPNGKMRVESTFYPSQTDEHENSIVFDGERGTMKVGGGPRSAFARRIADQIGFWVREKGCIPGFLAALTLEFYEEHNAAKAGEA
ncbi:[Phosphatase 2A protein]-leucine-carboxy methyltransferase [Purpureocillium takamizusanense]|uniref:Spindle assembly checkpoint component MAD1 n=1 Tax=Purpureocillium takamizusanense TaxID=2060973 RepID=A0A9Q8V6I3_9HYPO|nr:[Phosphatase 2A protein]-leucine-carboxy methyltransferase [Purpureocillium takamizusanense]UNI13356.1 [Phosphatase 2A protein]-leucine-carboxy methyltransferase [Purpureocillium takamizusanense]